MVRWKPQTKSLISHPFLRSLSWEVKLKHFVAQITDLDTTPIILRSSWRKPWLFFDVSGIQLFQNTIYFSNLLKKKKTTKFLFIKNVWVKYVVCMLGVSPSLVSRWREAYIFGVFENLKFKISEGSDQNWWFPASAQLAVSAKLRQLTGQTKEITNFGPTLLKF